MLLLAEDLLLLLLDDDTGRPVVDGTKLDLALAGAVVLELAGLSRLDVSGPGEQVKPGRLVVREQAATGDPVLDEGLRRVAGKGPKKPQNVLPAVAKGLRQDLLARLVDRGVLRAEEDRVLWVFPRRSWPAVESDHERTLLRALHDVLVDGRAPLPREVAIVSLLAAVDALPKVLPRAGLENKELERRAKAVAEGEFAGAAVRKAVAAVQSALTAATVTVAAGAAAASS